MSQPGELGATNKKKSENVSLSMYMYNVHVLRTRGQYGRHTIARRGPHANCTINTLLIRQQHTKMFMELEHTSHIRQVYVIRALSTR